MLPSYPFVKQVFMEKQFLFCNVETVWKKLHLTKGGTEQGFPFGSSVTPSSGVLKLCLFPSSAHADGEARLCSCSSPLLFRKNQKKELAWKSNLTSLFCKITEKRSRAAGNQSKTAFGTRKWKARYVWEDASVLKSDEHREWKEHR